MSNRTDFDALAKEITTDCDCGAGIEGMTERVETELHNAHVAGKEGSPCLCSVCRATEDRLWWTLTEAGLSLEEIQGLDPTIRKKITAFMAPRVVRRLTR